MTSPDSNPGQLSEEAALWHQRMTGPFAKDHAEEFERWLRRGASHSQAYDEIVEVDRQSGLLKGVVLQRRRDLWRAPKVSRLQNWWLLPALAGALILGLAGLSHVRREQMEPGVRITQREALPDRSRIMQALALATRQGEIRSFDLRDGSRVTLDTDNLVAVAFDPEQRLLRLQRGRARFEVAHDGRPFVVAAGRGSIIAHGTIFDVELLPGDRVSVHLLRGAIDVRTQSERVGKSGPTVVAVSAGRTVSYSGDANGPAQANSDSPPADWPTGLVAYQGTPLAQVVEEINRYGSKKIMLGSPILGSSLVYGSVRVTDPEQAVSALAGQFGLSVTTTRDRIVLRAR